MEKRGQFYLIAALVIVGIIAGMVSIYNFAKTSDKQEKVYDLTSEIDYEASQVIDSGIFRNLTSYNLSTQLENLTDYYADANPDSDLLIIFGNESMLTLILYNNSQTGSVDINFVGNPISFPQFGGTKYNITQPYEARDTIDVIIPPNVIYTFNLAQGQIFYIVLRKESAGQTFVSSSDSTQGGKDKG